MFILYKWQLFKLEMKYSNILKNVCCCFFELLEVIIGKKKKKGLKNFILHV